MAAAAPARAPRTAPRRARPARRTAPARRPPKRQNAAARAITPPAGLLPAAVNRVGDLADSGLMQRLTRSRAWIGVLGVLLAGIVTVNVLSLSYTASGGRIADRSETLGLRNAELRSELTKKMAGPRIEAVAAANGLIVPEGAEITYLTAGEKFAKVAAHRIQQGLLTSGAAPAPEPAPVEPAPVEAVDEPVVPIAAQETAPVTPETAAP
jgi:hypothetical protein